MKNFNANIPYSEWSHQSFSSASICEETQSIEFCNEEQFNSLGSSTLSQSMGDVSSKQSFNDLEIQFSKQLALQDETENNIQVQQKNDIFEWLENQGVFQVSPDPEFMYYQKIKSQIFTSQCRKQDGEVSISKTHTNINIEENSSLLQRRKKVQSLNLNFNRY